MASYISNEPIILQEKGIKYKIFHPKDYGFDFYNDIFIYIIRIYKIILKNNKNFYEATIKGWEYALLNKSRSSWNNLWKI